ncbi:MAG: adenosylmethionine--8-amino-7-oxononanoate transaminase [Flavobacteriales bacterium]|nr:adenosylmethionine--8-amino-7-oxononanoate transaminase [Flavobacteriales bacterium]
MTELQEKNLKYNWHPYTQHKTSSAPIVITKGKDAILYDENGNEYIDGIASWWCNPHGHSNEFIAKKIYEQATTLEHVLFGGFTHNKAIELSEKLLNLLPANQSKIFYSDNGSTAVEVALKMCLQYYVNKNQKKNTFIAFEDAFHGDTFGAMATSGISLFTDSFKDNLLSVTRIPVPNEENFNDVYKKLEKLLKSGKIAGFIFEPLVLGAAGMKMYEAKHLNQLIKLCKKYNTFTIADEVMTGFYRTGKLFATDYLTYKPDIMCLSKALTGGFVPLSITSCSREIYNGFYDNDVSKAFFHGHTFMANPIGCAAALASLELTLSEKTQRNLSRIYKLHNQFANQLSKNSKVENIRTKGTIVAFDIKQNNENIEYYGELRNLLYDEFIKNKIILRPVGNTIYIFPPYCITYDQLHRIYTVIERVLGKL